MGDQLVRLLMVVIFGAIAVAMYGGGRKPAEVAVVGTKVGGFVGEAASLAKEQGDEGASIVVTSATQGGISGYQLAVMRSRPFAGFSALATVDQTFTEAKVAATSEGVAIAVPFVILVSPSGAVSMAAYSGPVLTVQPACATGMTVSISFASRTAQHSLTCGGVWQ